MENHVDCTTLTTNIKFDVLAGMMPRREPQSCECGTLIQFAEAVLQVLGRQQEVGICVRICEEYRTTCKSFSSVYKFSSSNRWVEATPLESYHSDNKEPIKEVTPGPGHFLLELCERAPVDGEWMRIQITTPVRLVNSQHKAQMESFLTALTTMKWPLTIDNSSDLQVLAAFCRCKSPCKCHGSDYCGRTCRSPSALETTIDSSRLRKILSVVVILKLALLNRLCHPNHKLTSGGQYLKPEETEQMHEHGRGEFWETELQYSTETKLKMKKYIPEMNKFTAPQSIFGPKYQVDASDAQRRIFDTFYTIWDDSSPLNSPTDVQDTLYLGRILGFTGPLRPHLTLDQLALKAIFEPSFDIELVWNRMMISSTIVGTGLLDSPSFKDLMENILEILNKNTGGDEDGVWEPLLEALGLELQIPLWKEYVQRYESGWTIPFGKEGVLNDI